MAALLYTFMSCDSTSRHVLDAAVQLQLASLGSSTSCEAQTVDCQIQIVSWGVLVRTITISLFRTLDSKRECPKQRY